VVAFDPFDRGTIPSIQARADRARAMISSTTPVLASA
jgi:hypothetical protein